MKEGVIKFWRSLLVVAIAIGFIFQTTAYALTLPDSAEDVSGIGEDATKIQLFSDCLNQFMELEGEDIEFCAGQSDVAGYLEGTNYYSFAACLNNLTAGNGLDDIKPVETNDIYACKTDASKQYSEEIIELTPPAYSVDFSGDSSSINILTGPQNLDFNINGLPAAQIGEVNGFIINSEGESSAKVVEQISGTKYNFVWDTNHTAVGNYIIRIVVRGPKSASTPGTDGPLVMYSDTPILAVEQNHQFTKTIDSQDPYINVADGTTKLVFEGVVGGSGASTGNAAGSETITVNYIVTTTANGKVEDQLFKAEGVVTNGKYKIEVEPPNGLAAAGLGKKNTAYALSQKTWNRIKTFFWVTQPVGTFAYFTAKKELKIIGKLFKKTAFTGHEIGGDGSGGGGVGGGGTGPNVSTDTATGLGALMSTLKGLVTPIGGGDPKQELTLRILAVLNLLIEFASAILALAAVWTGLLYIFSMGNDEQAGKAKKNFILIISGLIILMSALGIITLVRNLLENGKIGG